MTTKNGKKTAFPAVQLCLVLLFLMGAAMVFAVQKGKNLNGGAGSGAENSFSVIYDLARDADTVWERGIRPALDRLPEGERTAADGVFASLFAAEKEEEPLPGDPAIIYKTLFISWQFTGPKLNATERKKITGLGIKETEELRQDLLLCIADETRALPPAAKSRARKLSGTERQAMLAQMFFTSCGTCAPELPDHVNQMKKSVRGKEQQKQAFRMIAYGEVNWFSRLIAGRGNTVILLGVLFMLDAVLLALMMAS